MIRAFYTALLLGVICVAAQDEDCSGRKPCTDAGWFCNYDSGMEGQCEKCTTDSATIDCFTAGLNAGGEQDCHTKCHTVSMRSDSPFVAEKRRLAGSSSGGSTAGTGSSSGDSSGSSGGEIVSKNYLVKSSLGVTGFCADTFPRAQFISAIAAHIGVSASNVNVTSLTNAASSTGCATSGSERLLRNLASTKQVVVAYEIADASSTGAQQLKSKINTMSSSSADLTSFVDTFKTKLQAEGYQTTDIEVPPSSVTTAELVVLTPAPTRSPTMAPSALPTEATPAPPKAYVPSDVVTKLNGFPHDVTTFDPANTDYLMGIVKISAGPIIVFIICYLFYWSFLCGRNCSHCCPVKCCRCPQKECCFPPVAARMFLGLMFLLAIVVMAGAWGPRNNLQDGLKAIQAAVSTGDKNNGHGLADIFSRVEGNTAKLEANAVSLESASDNVNLGEVVMRFGSVDTTKECNTDPATAQISEGLGMASDALKEAVVSMKDSTSQLSTKLTDMQRQLEQNGGKFVDIGVIAMTGAIVLAAGMGLLATMCRSQRLLTLTAFLSFFTLLLMAVLLGAELGASVMVADYCMAPEASSVAVMEKLGMTESLELFQYYSTCEGVSPIQGYVDNATVQLGQFSTFATSLQPGGEAYSEFGKAVNDSIQTACASDPCNGQEYYTLHDLCSASSIDALSTTGADTSTILDTFIAESSCAPLNDIYRKLVHDALCDHVIKGFYGLWLVQAMGSIILFINLFFANLIRAKFSTTAPGSRQDKYNRPGDSRPNTGGVPINHGDIDINLAAQQSARSGYNPQQQQMNRGQQQRGGYDPRRDYNI
jgi:hypothetical protein